MLAISTSTNNTTNIRDSVFLGGFRLKARDNSSYFKVVPAHFDTLEPTSNSHISLFPNTICRGKTMAYLGLPPLLPNVTTSALYPYTNILALTLFSVRGNKSVGQKTPFFAVHVFLGSPFNPCTNTMSTFASGCEYTSVTSKRFISDGFIAEP